MKKIAFILVAFCFQLPCIAQHTPSSKPKIQILQMPDSKAVDYLIYNDKCDTQALKQAQNKSKSNNTPNNRGGRQALIGTKIGSTTYDLQTNGSDPQRLVLGPNGKLAATWTGSTSFTPGRADRGTFYNYFDGNNWNSYPTSRLESQRTGWPTNLITSSGKEVIFSHNPQTGNYHLIMIDRDTLGTGSWNDTTPGLDGIWPRVVVGGSNGETIHLLNANYNGAGDNSFTQYFRSPDGGDTWDTVAKILPGIDTASGYNLMKSDVYAIDSRGDIVAVVAGAPNNPLAVWKSTDNGVTWTRTEILSHPIPNMDGYQITDIDSNNTADTIDIHDGSHAILIDTSGTVHVWTGFMRIIDTDSTNGMWSYFPATNGLLYWNETFGTDSMQNITGALDLDGDNILEIGIDVPIYGTNISSFPTAALDATTDTIFLIYSAAVENTDFYNDPSNPAAQSFRDLYGMYTGDGGQTWSPPVNLTRSAVTWYESVYPSAARIADGKVHVIWQRDQEPGNSIEPTPDPITSNDIVYNAFDYADFEPKPPIADWDHTVILGNTIQFNDSSKYANLWFWDFDDGLTSTARNPLHTFTTAGTYNVCLIVNNTVGSDTLCVSITVGCSTPIVNFGFTYSTLTVNFIDSSSNATSWSWDFGDGNTSSLKNPANTYTTQGTYWVCLTATNSCGPNTYCDSVSVICPKPSTKFGYNNSGLTINFSDSSSNSNSWFWTFGDGDSSTNTNPSHTYASSGVYQVCLIATNNCGSDTLCDSVTVVLTSIEELQNIISIYPIPNNNILHIDITLVQSTEIKISLYDVHGARVLLLPKKKMTGLAQIKLDLSMYPNGFYLLKIQSEKNILTKKIVLSKTDW